jgi:hypothetical protein
VLKKFCGKKTEENGNAENAFPLGANSTKP